MMRTLIIACLATLASTHADASVRSKSSIRQFKLENPCPSNSNRKGVCPGFEIDHIYPLKCGGSDDPSNMQWLSKDSHKAKTSKEAWMCRKTRRHEN